MSVKAFLHKFSQSSCHFKGRPLSVQQQMMQQSRQLDPNLLVKQQTPPSQQQSLHQPAMKSFLENVMPHTTPELQKGPSPINAFSNFPIGGFLHGQSIWLVLGHHRSTCCSLTCPGLFFTCSLSAVFVLQEDQSLFKKITLFQKFHAHSKWVRIKMLFLSKAQISSL